MELDNKQVYIGIFAIALVICLLSPFLASGDPDGLEASAEHINPDALEAEPPEPYHMVCDKPFVYYITDTLNDDIAFIGFVKNIE